MKRAVLKLFRKVYLTIFFCLNYTTVFLSYINPFFPSFLMGRAFVFMYILPETSKHIYMVSFDILSFWILIFTVFYINISVVIFDMWYELSIMWIFKLGTLAVYKTNTWPMKECIIQWIIPNNRFLQRTEREFQCANLQVTLIKPFFFIKGMSC